MRLCVSLILIASALIAEPAKVTIFSGLENQFKLLPPDSTTPPLLRLEAQTSLKLILVRIQKKGSSREHRYLLQPGPDGFRADFLLSEGPGPYDVTLFGSRTLSLQYTGLASFQTVCTGGIPKDLDRSLGGIVLEESKKRLGKQVGRGECWDLAQEILDEQGAEWSRPTDFGQRIDLRTEEAKPGDIIQMYSLVLVYPDHTEYFGMPQHTAVIASVDGRSNFGLLHQNIAGKRYVIEGRLDLSHLRQGRFDIYRPIKGMWRK